MSNVFHDLGKVTSNGIKNLIASIKSANNVWLGTNSFLKKVDVGTDSSTEHGAHLTVGTENVKQELSVHGKIKQDNQAIGNFWDFINGVGQIRANIYPQATTAGLPADPKVGEVWFNTEEVTIVVWSGTEWVPIGGGPKTRFLTVMANVGGTAISDPGGVIQETDSNVKLIATPDFGYQFDYWSGIDPEDISSVNLAEAYVLMSDNFVAIANFKVRQFLLTINSTDGGSAYATDGLTEYDFGSTVDIVANPDPGYDFIGWSGGTFSDSFSENSTVIIDNDLTVLATFSIKKYFLEVTHIGSGTATGSGTYDHGTQAQITATPDVGFNFDGWSGNGVLSSSDLSTTVDMTEARSVTANFSIKTYLLTVNSQTGGTATGGGTYDHGTQVTVEATADDVNGYEFDRWDGDNLNSLTANPSTVNLIDISTVTAYFKLKTYTLTLQVGQGGGGTATSTDENFPEYEHGSTATLVATPDSIHDFWFWSNTTGNPVGNNSHTTTNTITVDEPLTVLANFQLKQYVLSVTAGTGGTVTGGGTFEHGTQASIEATANDAAGYEFDYWSGDNLVSASSSSTTVNMIGDSAVVANFKLKQYGVTVSAYSLSTQSAGGGTVTGSGTEYEHGEQVNITATPDANHDFVNWTGATVNNATSASTYLTMSGAVSVIANFQYKTYLLTLTAGTGGTVSGGGTYEYNEQVTITATPSTGYDFTGWQVDTGSTTIASTTNAETIATIVDASTISANFSIKQYTVMLGSSLDGAISLDGYYPLYILEADANAAGSGTSHTQVINGITYYMPDGVTMYHGNHTPAWFTSMQINDPDDSSQSLGLSAQINHGTGSTTASTPAEHYEFVNMTSSPSVGISNAKWFSNVLGPTNLYHNFNYRSYTLEGKSSNYSGSEIYFNDILNSGYSLADNALPGLVADGVLTAGGNSGNYMSDTFPALSTVSIRCEGKNGYQFVRWVEPAGQNLITDRNSSDTTVLMRPEGDNTDDDSVEFFAEMGLEPIPNYTWKNEAGWETEHYFSLDQEVFDGSSGPTNEASITASTISAEYLGSELTPTAGNPYLRIHSNKIGDPQEYLKVSTNHYWNFNKSWVIFWKGITVQGGITTGSANHGSTICGGNNDIYLRKDMAVARFYQTNARIYNVSTGVGTGVSVGGQDPYNYFKGHGWLHYDHTTRVLKNGFSYGDGGNSVSYSYGIDFDSYSMGHTANNTEMYLFGVPDNNNVYISPDWVITHIGMLDSVTTLTDFKNDVFPLARDDWDSVSWSDTINITSTGLTKTGSNISAVSLENGNGNNFQTSKIFNFTGTGQTEESTDITVAATNSQNIEKTETQSVAVRARVNTLYVMYDFALVNGGDPWGSASASHNGTSFSISGIQGPILNGLSSSNFSDEDVERVERYMGWGSGHTFNPITCPVIEGTVVDISVTPKAGVVFDRWIVPEGYESKIGNINSATTTIEVSGSRDFYIYAAFRLPPEANFGAAIPTTSGARYDVVSIGAAATAPAGSEIELLSSSTAPARNRVDFVEDLIVSEAWSATGGTINQTGDTGIRLHGGLTNYIEIDNPGNCLDMTKEWTILLDIIPLDFYNRTSLYYNHTLYNRSIFGRGKWGWGGFLGGPNAGLAYNHKNNGDYNTTALRSTGTNWSHKHYKYSLGFDPSVGWYNGTSGATGSRYGSFKQYGLRDKQMGVNGTTANMNNHYENYYPYLGTSYFGSLPTEAINWTSPNNMINSQATLINSGEKLTIGWWAGWNRDDGDGSAFILRDVIFFNRMITSTETTEFMATRAQNLSSLSFYGDRVDHIECGTGTFPNVNGKDGVITGRVVKNSHTPTVGVSYNYDFSQPYNDYDPSMFIDIPYLTLPSGSGTVNVTHSITTKKGHSDSITKAINYA